MRACAKRKALFYENRCIYVEYSDILSRQMFIIALDVISLFTSGNHASGIGDRVHPRERILRRDSDVEGLQIPPFRQAPDETEGDPRFQAGVHLHGDRIREEGTSRGRDPGLR